jgi:hypothetical protein
MKIIFEGTNEQIENLKTLIGKGNKNLPLARQDYQTENLWCVSDVLTQFDCTKDEALEVLEQSLTSDNVMQSVWENINYYGTENQLNIKTYENK